MINTQFCLLGVLAQFPERIIPCAVDPIWIVFYVHEGSDNELEEKLSKQTGFLSQDNLALCQGPYRSLAFKLTVFAIISLGSNGLGLHKCILDAKPSILRIDTFVTLWAILYPTL